MTAPFLSPALAELRSEVDAMAPDRSKVSDGWLGDAAHAARHSDHNPEPDGSVDAIDITHDPAHGVDCSLLADQVKDDPRLVGGGYVIWNWQIWNPDIARIWRPYTGTNGHTKHMHVSVSDRGQNDTSPWLEEDELMGKADDILDKLNELDRDLPEKGGFDRLQNRVKAIGPALRAIQEGRPIDKKIIDLIEGD